jgi:hypothetical protein
MEPLALIAALLCAVAPAWELESTEPDGTTVESREVGESSFPELRVTAHAAASTDALSEAAWEVRDTGMQMLYLEARSVLSESKLERLLYMRVHPPIFGARECVLQQQRVFDRASGAARVWYRPVNPRAMTGYRPFAQLRGEWRFEPDLKGGSHVVYTMLVDLGGIPAWLARGAQQDAALATVREIIARAGEL